MSLTNLLIYVFIHGMCAKLKIKNKIKKQQTNHLLTLRLPWT
jgi:hypothetical protein